MFEDDSFFKAKHKAVLHRETDPFFIVLSTDIRTKDASMEFQHFHSFYEIYMLLDNSSGCYIEGQYYALHEGDIVLYAPGRLHKGVYMQDCEVRRFLISFMIPEGLVSREARRRLDALFRKEVPIFRFSSEINQKLFPIIGDIFRENEKIRKECAGDFMIAAKVLEFLYKLMRYADTEENSYTNQEFDTITHKIYSISSYIHKHYSEPLSLEMLADRFFISSCYLSRRFKDVSGYTIVHFIQQTRIKNAQHMLVSGSESIQEISTACGFSSFSQFSRVFHKYTGMTPREYRQSGMPDEIME